MKNPSDSWEEMRQKVLGLGDSSVRKTHYPSLRQRKEELERFRSLVDISSDLLFMVELPSGRILDVSASSAEHLGIERGALCSRLFSDFVSSADWQAILSSVEKLHQGQRPYGLVNAEIANPAAQSTLPVEIAVQHLQMGNSAVALFAARDITERKRAEEIISGQEMELRQVLDLTPLLVAVFGPNRERLYANRPALDYFGVTLEEWRKITDRFRFYHPDDQERIAREAYTGDEIQHEFEARFRKSDGSYRWFLFRDNPVRDEQGRITRWYFSATDIDDRKRAEESLYESETRFRTFVDHAADAFFVHDQENKVLDVNRQACENLGYTREELIGMHPVDFDPDIDASKLLRIRERLAVGEVFTFETRHRRKDGSVFPVEVSLRSFRRGDHQLHLALVRDITERKRAEEKIRQNEAELRQLVDVIPQQVFVFNADWSPVFANRRELEYTGLTAQEMQSNDAVARIFHPEDLEKLEVARWQALSDSAPFDMEARIRGKNGGYRWFLIRDNPLCDEQGHVLRWYGTRTDIEDRKQAEEMVRQSEAELRQILDVGPAHLAIVGPNGERLYLNQAALEYRGLKLEEWQSGDVSRFYHPDDWERENSKVKAAFAGASPFEFEARMRIHDGTYPWFSFRYKPLRFEQGRVTRWAVAAIDIEERKKSEERLRNENVVLREEIDKAFEEIVGTSPGLQFVLSRISKVAPTDSTVLISGETGTGKELIARAIHRQSHRSARPFVAVNCAAVPRDLIASELFGHEKGAFTGAVQQRLGRFELAGGGTIFMDEVGDLPAETQVALLRVLQEHEFERVGGNRSIQADVRVIAATNRDLPAAIAAGSFRRDLFYRLNVFPIEVPSLRERKEDIPLLAEFFIQRYARKAGKNIRRVDKKSLELFMSYPWPGNIRELQNVIQRSVILCETEVFSVDESWLTHQPIAADAESMLNFTEKLTATERELIEAALRESGGRVYGPKGAAVKLNMPRSTLEAKIRSLKINKNLYKTTHPTSQD